MTDFSRREFLKRIGALTSLCLASQSVLPFAKSADDFEMLVIGDSLVWGQGLEEENKFYTLTRNWLEQEVFNSSRRINLKVKAHSGARIFLHEDESKALREAEKAADQFYYPEVNFSFPDMKTQIETARREYKNAAEVRLVMLTGGITDINVSDVLSPFNSNKKLREDIPKYCNETMFRLLEYAANVFPNALFTVIGYYPLVSKRSSTGKIYNTILELYEFPGPTKPLMNNLLTKQFFKALHHKMSKRSQIWATGSDRELQQAVRRLNEKLGMKRAVFVKSPINPTNCFATKNSLVWEMGKKGRVEDTLYDTRKMQCREAIESVKDVRQKFKTRFCELDALGHPNIAGSKLYAEEIKKVLKPVFQS